MPLCQDDRPVLSNPVPPSMRRGFEGERPRSLHQAPDSQLRVLVADAGYKRRSPQVLSRLQAAFAELGVETWPALTAPDVASDERIYLFHQGDTPRGLRREKELFVDHEALQSFLVDNFALLDFVRDRQLHLVDRGSDGIGEHVLSNGEVKLRGNHRIDLLAEDQHGGLVGIELKPHAPEQRLIAQMAGYMDDLEWLASRHDRPSYRGLVVTGMPDAAIRSELDLLMDKHGWEYDWLIYRRFSTEPAPR